MKPENHDEALLEQGLAAWDVPEPPPGLTDRILAQNAETLTALSTPQNPTPPEPPALEPDLKEDTPAMMPTDLRSESSMRPFWTATALGFAAAAAIVLAFMAGRQSTTAPVSPNVPNVEIQVSAPAPVALPPVPPVPPAPSALPEKIIFSETSEPVDPIAKPPRVRGVRGVPISEDLKNPFGPNEEPPTTRKRGSSKGIKGLKNPFDPVKPCREAGLCTKASGVNASGGGDQKAIKATITHRANALQQCYSKVLKTQPDLAGELSIGIRIDATGSVTSVAIEEDTLGDASVKACAKAKIMGWRFPMAGADMGAEVSFIVVFSDS